MKIQFTSRTALIAVGIVVVGICVLGYINPDLASQALDLLGQWISSSPAT